ncbi:uncharacterized protein XM38_021330 [Halomicronema hongdechloris C2206]|uniref:DUF4335 domain-containing protein n=1 Tax=Halomicronema hongdechloris C2206 TaxID=1641165 RepID=A0A1Z3HLJ9_9CYAN|nr:DUF4335 domain-containing protein [Halomicronema hongdechloris]ASC71181.1 uncharacterized protein XM38_021330 [Halomicronema hongdechloris C2206]
MTLKRRYTLPNCNLIVEGLSLEQGGEAALLSAVINAECHLAGVPEPLTGGREFLEALVKAVNRYGQTMLSDVLVPPRPGEAPSLVELKPGEGPYHHLIVRSHPDPEATDDTAKPPRDIQLSTVQFFDLMEAVDQLQADTQTLPDLSLDLQPISRRRVKPPEPATKRLAPAMIGASAFAAAAVALFFVPPPEFEPSRSREQTEATSPTATPDGTNEEASNGDPPSDSSDSDPLTTSQPITDPETLATLRESLVEQLTAAWAPPEDLSDALIFRVSVSAAGDILGYKYENQLAVDRGDDTPLPDLTYVPVEGDEPIDEPVALFRITFLPNGDVSASPLEDTAATTPAVLSDTITTPITTGPDIRRLNRDLYDQMQASWDSGDLDQDLAYRVRLSEDGTLVGYEAVDQAAAAALVQTPLPELKDAADPVTSSTPQADFRVVFTANGELQVSPWDGWPSE